jgi:ABC-type Na+ transport system ATPase subunit NatA
VLTLESVTKRFRGGNYGVREVSLDINGGVLGLLGAPENDVLYREK